MATTTQPPLTADTWWDVVPGRTAGVTPLFERCKRLLGWDNTFCTLICAAYREFIDCKRFWRDWNATLLSPSIPVDQMWHQHLLDTQRYFDDCQLLVGRMIHHNPDGDVDAAARALRIQRTKDLLAARNGAEILKSRAWNFDASTHVEDVDSPSGGEQLSRRRARVSDEVDSSERNVQSRLDSSKKNKIDEFVTLILREAVKHETNGQVSYTPKDTYFKIKKTTKLSKLFHFFAQMRGKDAKSLVFLLDGCQIDRNLTPAELELEDLEGFDVMPEQVGC